MNYSLSKLGLNANQHMYLNWFQRLLSQHGYALSAAIGRLSRTPVATCMTIAVIGLALALPAGLLLFLGQAETIIEKWHQGTQISVFVEQAVTQSDIEKLVDQLRQDQRIANIRYIPPADVMQQFQEATGVNEWSRQLGDNPLPGVIEIVPAFQKVNSKSIEGLVTELKQLPKIEIAQLDVEWLSRLQAIIDLIKQALLLVLVFIGVGVVLVVANTIRLIQELYRHELDVMRLVGATQRFISRPFIYSGLFYGILGGITAWLILDFFIVWLHAPLEHVFYLYHADVLLSELDLYTLIILVSVGALFGFMGSLSSVFLFSLKQERETLL